ncbi:hypothetical protein ALC152_06380 [Arcobacter sp. 15-2]|uniref:hypothetical protein n=1 Tax=Arcobacter sp. 15-2 TaxID=3374109 RepID=UPI00399C809B
MNNFYEKLLEHDLNPYFIFNANGKILKFNKEAEFLLNYVSIKELFNLAVDNASQDFGFSQKFIPLKFNKHEYYAILVGYTSDDEIALRLYKVVSNQTNTINSDKLKLVNIFSLIELSKNTTLLNSNLKIKEVYDISLPEMKININEFLLCLNECFKYFIEDDEITLKVKMKVGEYEVIDNQKYKIMSLLFSANRMVKGDHTLEEKANRSNVNIFFSQNSIKLELPIIL